MTKTKNNLLKSGDQCWHKINFKSFNRASKNYTSFPNIFKNFLDDFVDIVS